MANIPEVAAAVVPPAKNQLPGQVEGDDDYDEEEVAPRPAKRARSASKSATAADKTPRRSTGVESTKVTPVSKGKNFGL